MDKKNVQNRKTPYRLRQKLYSHDKKILRSAEKNKYKNL
jgi:hypothetical protein